MIKELLAEDVGKFREVTSNIAEEGYKYYFNGQRVTAEVSEGGIERWLKNDKTKIKHAGKLTQVLNTYNITRIALKRRGKL